jgi:hypothetical protein
MRTDLMRTILRLFVLLLAVSHSFAADSYLGGKASVTTLHPLTNYFVVVLGDHDLALVRKINPVEVLTLLKSSTNWNAIANSGGIGTNQQSFGTHLFHSLLFVPSGGAIVNSNSGYRRRVAEFDSNQQLSPVTEVDDTEIRYLDGVTSSIQGQLNAKASTTAVSNLEGATNGLTTRATNLEGSTNGLTTRATNLEGATNGLTARATNLEGATNGLTTRATNLEGATNGLNARMTNNPAYGVGSITVTNHAEFRNGNTNFVYLKAAPTNNVMVTNLLGTVHVAASAVIVFDANQAHDWNVTNRISAATTIVITNTADGQTINWRMLGEASGGSSRVVTIIPHLGQLIADEDDFSVALATSTSLTLTNGNGLEGSWSVRRQNGTNTAGKVTRQHKG